MEKSKPKKPIEMMQFMQIKGTAHENDNDMMKSIHEGSLSFIKKKENYGSNIRK